MASFSQSSMPLSHKPQGWSPALSSSISKPTSPKSHTNAAGTTANTTPNKEADRPTLRLRGGRELYSESEEEPMLDIPPPQIFDYCPREALGMDSYEDSDVDMDDEATPVPAAVFGGPFPDEMASDTDSDIVETMEVDSCVAERARIMTNSSYGRCSFGLNNNRYINNRRAQELRNARRHSRRPNFNSFDEFRRRREQDGYEADDESVDSLSGTESDDEDLDGETEVEDGEIVDEYGQSDDEPVVLSPHLQGLYDYWAGSINPRFGGLRLRGP